MNFTFPEPVAPVAAAPQWAVRSVFVLAALFPLGAVSYYMVGSVLYTLLALLCAVYAAPAWRAATRAERHLIVGFGLLFAIAALSLFNTTNLMLGLEKLDRFLRIATLGLIFLGLRRFGVIPGRWFVASVLLGAFVVAGQALYQKSSYPVSQPAVGLYHKIIFGDTAMLLAGVLAVALCTLPLRRVERILLMLGMAAALYACVMSQTRGAWLFVPVALALLGWLNRHRFSRRIWLGMGVAVVFAGGFLLTQPNPVTRHIQRGLHELELFHQNPAEGTSWGIRLNLWRNALIVWREHPILGTGLGDLEQENMRLVKEGTSLSPHVDFAHAHSIYFHALATTGILGFLALMAAFLVLPFRYFLRGWRVAHDPWARFYALGGLMTVAAFAVFGFSEGLLTRNAFVNHYVMYIAVFWAGLSARLHSVESSASPH